MTSTNVVGQACSLAVVAPIRSEHAEPLRAYLAQLQSGEQSPLASLSTVHFARWVVFTLPIRRRGDRLTRSRTAYLLFDACFDGALDSFLDAMCARMGAEADAVWQHCEGYSSSSDPQSFARFFRRHMVDARLFLAAYPDATVQDVRASLALRKRIIDFAVATQELDAPALLATYLRAFEGSETASPAVRAS